MAETVPIRDAATVILVRDPGGAPSVLMGQRGASAAFMPSKFVFPGGAVDDDDAVVPLASPLPERCQCALRDQNPGPTPGTLAIAAVRELFEETGLMVGAPHNDRVDPKKLPEDWLPIFETGLAPRLDCLDYVARAVTPPNNVRRFNARFFIVDSRNTSGELGGSGELVDLQWIPIADALAMPNTPDPTSIALREVRRLLADGDPWNLPSGHAVPVYLARYGKDVLEYD